ncbi:MAG: DsbE family thiol:disulfide interchange protein [Gammaproteobacteria bacterium]
MARYLIPLGLFVVLVGFLGVGLKLDPRQVPSPFVGKPMPAFEMARLDDLNVSLSHEDLKGEVALLNVWASWCASCRVEHEFLMTLANDEKVPIYGLNYKDTMEDATRWLEQFGDPYKAIGFDEDGRVGIDWGVYGAPETFVIDRDGIIRYKHIGPLSQDDVDKKLLPLLALLKANNA